MHGEVCELRNLFDERKNSCRLRYILVSFYT